MSDKRVDEGAGEGQALEAGDVVRRLCHLSAEVYNWLSVDSPLAAKFGAADCFCGEGGFWSNSPDRYGPTHEQGYRNDGKILEFIETAVRARLNADAAVRHPDDSLKYDDATLLDIIACRFELDADPITRRDARWLVSLARKAIAAA